MKDLLSAGKKGLYFYASLFNTGVSAAVTQIQNNLGYRTEALYLGEQTGSELLARMFMPEYRHTDENAKFLQASFLDLPDNVVLDTDTQSLMSKYFNEDASTNTINFYPLITQAEAGDNGVLVFGPAAVNMAPESGGPRTIDSLETVLGKIGMLDPAIRSKFPKIIIPLVEKEGTKLGHGVTLVLEADEIMPEIDGFVNSTHTYDTSHYKGRVIDSRTVAKKLATKAGVIPNFDGLISATMAALASEGFAINMVERKYLGIQLEGTDDSSCGYYSLFTTKELIKNPETSIIKGSDWLSSETRIPYQHLKATEQEKIRRNILIFCINTDSHGKSLEKPFMTRIIETRSAVLELMDSVYPNNGDTIKSLQLDSLARNISIDDAITKDVAIYGEDSYLPVQRLRKHLDAQEASYPKISEFFDRSFMPTLGNQADTRQQSTINFTNMILKNEATPSSIGEFRNLLEMLSNAVSVSHKISMTEKTPDTEEPIQMMEASVKMYIEEAHSALDRLKASLQEALNKEDFSEANEYGIIPVEEEIESLKSAYTRNLPTLT